MADVAGPSRRDFGKAALLLAGIVGVPVAVLRAVRVDASERQRTIAAEVAQIVIPRTDTPGGADAGAHDFLILALAHGLDGTRAPQAGAAIQGAYAMARGSGGAPDYLAWLETTLDRRTGGDFTGATPAARAAAVGAVDADAFATRDSGSPWVKIKGLLLTGYYTSEAGGARELRYELVPGRFDPDLPLAPGDRAWSSDWTAVEFG